MTVLDLPLFVIENPGVGFYRNSTYLKFRWVTINKAKVFRGISSVKNFLTHIRKSVDTSTWLIRKVLTILDIDINAISADTFHPCHSRKSHSFLKK